MPTRPLARPSMNEIPGLYDKAKLTVNRIKPAG